MVCTEDFLYKNKAASELVAKSYRKRYFQLKFLLYLFLLGVFVND